MAKKEKKTYEIAVGLKKGHKITKNERKQPRPISKKGVSIIIINPLYTFMHLFFFIDKYQNNQIISRTNSDAYIHAHLHIYIYITILIDTLLTITIFYLLLYCAEIDSTYQICSIFGPRSLRFCSL